MHDPLLPSQPTKHFHHVFTLRRHSPAPVGLALRKGKAFANPGRPACRGLGLAESGRVGHRWRANTGAHPVRHVAAGQDHPPRIGRAARCGKRPRNLDYQGGSWRCDLSVTSTGCVTLSQLVTLSPSKYVLDPENGSSGCRPAIKSFRLPSRRYQSGRRLNFSCPDTILIQFGLRMSHRLVVL